MGWLRVATWLLAGLSALPAVVHAQEASGTQVRVVPALVRVASGQMADVAIEVQDVQGLVGADISLEFDPTAVEVVDADPNTPGIQVALGTFLDPGLVLHNTVDPAAGTLRLVTTQINPSPPKNGGGTLVVVKLYGLRPGTRSLLTLVRVQLANADGLAIPAHLISGEVEVTATPAPGPTNTPLPTQAPSLLLPTLVTQPVIPTDTPLPATRSPRPTSTLAPAAPSATAPLLAVTSTPAATSAREVVPRSLSPTASMSQTRPPIALPALPALPPSDTPASATGEGPEHITASLPTPIPVVSRVVPVAGALPGPVASPSLSPVKTPAPGRTASSGAIPLATIQALQTRPAGNPAPPASPGAAANSPWTTLALLALALAAGAISLALFSRKGRRNQKF